MQQLEAGPDQCEFCQRGYYAELGYYCADCDASVCPFCVITVFVRRCVLCPDCGGSE